jgi:hypothetical protein
MSRCLPLLQASSNAQADLHALRSLNKELANEVARLQSLLDTQRSQLASARGPRREEEGTRSVPGKAPVQSPARQPFSPREGSHSVPGKAKPGHHGRDADTAAAGAAPGSDLAALAPATPPPQGERMDHTSQRQLPRKEQPASARRHGKAGAADGELAAQLESLAAENRRLARRIDRLVGENADLEGRLVEICFAATSPVAVPLQGAWCLSVCMMCAGMGGWEGQAHAPLSGYSRMVRLDRWCCFRYPFSA